MTYKIYAIGGLSVIAIILALAYNPAEEVEIPNYDFEEIVSDELKNNDQYIITTYQNSKQWDWIKNQVISAEESDDIESIESDLTSLTKSVSNKVITLENRINSLNAKISVLENQKVQTSSNSDEITSFYTSDGSDKEDRFNQGDTVYFYATIDTDANTLYYEIINDDTNDEVKDRRLNVRDNNQLAWAWTIPSTQDDGDYYIEIDVGSANERIFFEIR